MAISVTIGADGLHIADGEMSPIQSKRPGRGKSVLACLSDYVAVDLETTGLSPEYNEIIEIACVRVRGGSPVDTFSHLVRPHEIWQVNEYITELTGISPDMLANEPAIEDVLPQALAFIGNDPVVGHRVSFDVNFIYDNAARIGLGSFSNDYIDTMRMARRLFPDFPNHKLKTLVKRFGIADHVAHRAEKDAVQTHQCYAHMTDYISKNNLSDALLPHTRRGLHAADVEGNPELFREDSPLFEKVVVFTGTLEKMTRREAMQLVADLGGINGDGITKKTNYLVLGNNDMCASIKDGKSTKQKKAEKYILAGADLDIISENVFYDMLEQ